MNLFFEGRKTLIKKKTGSQNTSFIEPAVFLDKVIVIFTSLGYCNLLHEMKVDFCCDLKGDSHSACVILLEFLFGQLSSVRAE